MSRAAGAVPGLGRALAAPRALARRLLRGAARPADAAAFARYAAAAAALGLDGPVLFLSFDCDTDRDIAAAPPLDEFLRARGIAATYAVPGAQLERGRDVYAALAARGAEFMNHGARPHAAWQGDRYVPVTFYNELTPAEVAADIVQGDAIVRAVTGRAPAGFRAPHFGCFQGEDDLALIYRTIEPLGYRYASTTVPARGLAHGPAYRRGGILELPTFGSARHPETILDSWTYLSDRRDYALSETYFALFAETVEVLTRRAMPAVLAWYADPAHVWGQAPFMKAMDLVAARGIPSFTGAALAERLGAALAAGVRAATA